MPQVRTSVRGPKMVFSNAFTRGVTGPRRGYQSFGGGFAPSFSSQVRWCEPGAPVRFPPNVCGGVQLGRTEVRYPEDGGSVQTEPTASHLKPDVSDLDGCPRFALSVRGPKWFFRMLSLEGNRTSTRISKPWWGLRPVVIRPRYAGANLGHPSDFLRTWWGCPTTSDGGSLPGRWRECTKRTNDITPQARRE